MDFKTSVDHQLHSISNIKTDTGLKNVKEIRDIMMEFLKRRHQGGPGWFPAWRHIK
jgi:hypothetical protein